MRLPDGSCSNWKPGWPNSCCFLNSCRIIRPFLGGPWRPLELAVESVEPPELCWGIVKLCPSRIYHRYFRQCGRLVAKEVRHGPLTRDDSRIAYLTNALQRGSTCPRGVRGALRANLRTSGRGKYVNEGCLVQVNDGPVEIIKWFWTGGFYRHPKLQCLGPWS